MTPQEELAALRAKLAARRNKPGLALNCEQLEARIAELEQVNGG